MGRMLVTPSTQTHVGSASAPVKARALRGDVPVAAAWETRTRTIDPARTAREGLRHPTLLPVLLFVVTLGLVLLRQGKLVEFLYPLCAVGIAGFLYWRSPAHYLGFVCWLVFLSPEVRRLADFTNGSFNPQSPIMVAPLAAVALTGLTLLKHVRLLGQRRTAPLVLIVVALLYAYIVGIAQVGLAAATFTLIVWLYPVMVAFYLLVTWRHYPAYHRVLLKTFVYGGILMSVYGLVEFVSPMPWDAFWLNASQMHSEGQAVPFGMRVSSTMNSCGPFAATLMVLILMSLAARGKTRILLGCIGIPVLLLTGVRSSWGGFAIALLYPLTMLDGKSRLRLLGALFGIALLAAPLMMIDQVSEPVMKRFDSMQNLGDDTSYQSRAAFYKTFMASALTDIAGQGFGSIGAGSKLSDDKSAQTMVDFDSGVMEVPYVMGWPGTLLYTTGILMMLWRGFRASRLRPNDMLAVCGVGVAMSTLAMMVMINTLTATSGMFFFIGVTLPVISLRYARARHARPATSPTFPTSAASATPAAAPVRI
ncbi:hypothetical protein PQQ51_21275 [Paraburkholderia xenovorans]|uniref:O-antigen ligase family protein n=1 Tax=Paraburkholderia xenovorans TaxID=36873 RepID=UPI0038BA293E